MNYALDSCLQHQLQQTPPKGHAVLGLVSDLRCCLRNFRCCKSFAAQAFIPLRVELRCCLRFIRNLHILWGSFLYMKRLRLYQSSQRFLFFWFDVANQITNRYYYFKDFTRGLAQHKYNIINQNIVDCQERASASEYVERTHTWWNELKVIQLNMLDTQSQQLLSLQSILPHYYQIPLEIMQDLRLLLE